MEEYIAYRARGDVDLTKLLVQADIRIMPEVYKSTQLMSTIAVIFGCGALLTFVFFPSAGLIAIYESIQDAATVMPCQDWEFWTRMTLNPSLPETVARITYPDIPLTVEGLSCGTSDLRILASSFFEEKRNVSVQHVLRT